MGMGTGTPSAFLHTEIHAGDDALDDLRSEWDELLDASRQQVYLKITIALFLASKRRTNSNAAWTRWCDCIRRAGA